MSRLKIYGAATLMLGTSLWPALAAAQSQAPASAVGEEAASGDIVVTARRRDETAISTPVVLSAIGEQELQTRAVNNLEGIARIVPQLVIGQADGGIQGGTISLRGISSGDANPFADTAVSFNIDGAQVARGSVQRMAQMDIGQVEVLKGPQALFFGKNSPAGIIVVHTNDPTDHFEAGGTLGYEFVGREVRGDGYVSGPLTDSLGARLAFYASDLGGWATNLAPDTGLTASSRDRLPHDREIAGRLTLKFANGGPFDAKLKIAYNRLRTDGPGENSQFVDCPLGAPQLGGPNDCTADNRVVRAEPGPNFAKVDPRFGDGRAFLHQRQVLGSIEANYALSSELKLTSVSSLYDVKLSLNDQFTLVPTPSVVLPSYNTLKISEVTEEIRLATELSGPLNFMVGGLYQDTKLDYFNVVALDAAAPFIIGPPKNLGLRGDAWSLFGQATYAIVPTVELSAGGRYSHESKSFSAVESGVAIVTPVPKRSWHNFSPEVTLSWRPDSNLTTFASYKRGFLSGGFNGGQGDPRLDQSYDQTEIKGFEGGIKARLFGGAVRTNLSVYDYKITGLQVTTLVGTTQTVRNAGGSTLKGAEFDVNWRPPVEGLSLHGATSYNHTRYDRFTTTCYTGQTIALGCSLDPVGGVYTVQSLAGQRLARAPRWTLSGGLNFEQAVSGDVRLALSADANYTSGFYTDATNKPASWQSAYWLVDSTLRLMNPSRGWEVALIGRNLTNRYYVLRTVDMPLTGSGTGTAGPAVLGDTSGFVSRGREIMLRLGFKFGANR